MTAEWLITDDGDALVRVVGSPLPDEWMCMEEAHDRLTFARGEVAPLLERVIAFAEAALDDEADPQGVVTAA